MSTPKTSKTTKASKTPKTREIYPSTLYEPDRYIPDMYAKDAFAFETTPEGKQLREALITRLLILAYRMSDDEAHEIAEKSSFTVDEYYKYTKREDIDRYYVMHSRAPLTHMQQLCYDIFKKFGGIDYAEIGCQTAGQWLDEYVAGASDVKMARRIVLHAYQRLFARYTAIKDHGIISTDSFPESSFSQFSDLFHEPFHWEELRFLGEPIAD